MNKIWKYRGREYPFDVTEKSCYGLVNRGLCQLRCALEGDCCDAGEVVPYEVRRFFDTVFGEGSGKNICGSYKSADEHIRAYVSFISFLCTQVDDFSRLRKEVEALL